MDAIGIIIPKLKYGHPIEAHMPIGTYDLEYSDLTSLSRTEKNSGNLSAVRKDLYHAMVILYEKKTIECERIIHSNADSILFDGASDKKRKTLIAMKDVVEQRMRKIFDLAMRAGMGANNVTDTLTPEEMVLYETLVEAAKAHWALLDRKKRVTIPDITQPDVPPEPVKETPTVIGMTVENITDNGGDIPQVEVIEPPESDAVPIDDGFPEIPEDEDEDPRNITIDIPEEPFAETPSMIPDKEETTILPKTDDLLEGDPMKLVVVRILQDLDEKISGIDRTYSLKKEDVVRIPRMLAKVLVNRNLAKIVNHA